MSSLLKRGAAVCAVPALLILCAGLGTIEAATVATQEPAVTDRAAQRSRVEARYEVVALSRGIGLRPKDRAARIKMIEITDGTIALDGVPVSGRELRERIGEADANLVVGLSYLEPQQLRSMFGLATEPPGTAPDPVEAPRAPEPPETVHPPEKAPATPAARERVTRRRSGDRVRIFGSVSVPRDELIQGDVVAVMGSVQVDGEVTGEVVAVMGSVTLGPEANIGGDIVAVGGPVRRAEGARVGGNITEVDFRGPGMPRDFRFAPWWMAPGMFQPFTGATRLMGTLFRLFVLGLLCSIVVLVLRGPVEQIGRRVSAEPVKMGAIGLLTQLLFFPVLFLVSILMAITIVLIPFLFVLIPIALVALLFVMLGGFTGAAYVIGGWAAGSARWSTDQPYLRVWLGIVIILTPLLIARVFGFGPGPFHALALILATIAVLIEYLVWTTGFGAALAASYQNWRMQRSLPPPVVPPPVTPTPE